MSSPLSMSQTTPAMNSMNPTYLKNTNAGPAPEEPTKRIEPNIEELSALSPEVIQFQATQNIGALGHVSHGKSTLVEGITGVKPAKYKEEELRHMTIKLGYANFKIYKCDSCPWPSCYKSFGSSFRTNKPPDAPCTEKGCKGTMKLMRHYSFVDCPGHDYLMSTMLNGAAVMDAALLVIASNQSVPQPQTLEHLAAAEIVGIQNIITVQTKLDLVSLDQAKQNEAQIKEFTRKTAAEAAPVIPISCTPRNQFNVDAILAYLCEKIPVPERDFKSAPFFTVIRSFDVNQPGEDFEKLKGGVAGGSLKRGVLKVGQEIEIRPGLITNGENGTVHCTPILSKVRSLFSEKNSIQFAVPGGLIAVGTTLDPTLTKGDRLVGQVIGLRGQLPEVYQDIEIKFHLMKRIIGTAKEDDPDAKPTKVKALKRLEKLLINVGPCTTYAIVTATKDEKAKMKFNKPCCVEVGEKISLSRKIGGSWRLIGHAIIVAGTPLNLENPV